MQGQLLLTGVTLLFWVIASSRYSSYAMILPRTLECSWRLPFLYCMEVSTKIAPPPPPPIVSFIQSVLYLRCTVLKWGNKATPGVSLVGVCVASYSGLGQTCSTAYTLSCTRSLQSAIVQGFATRFLQPV